jgi:hypothetical protein
MLLVLLKGTPPNSFSFPLRTVSDRRRPGLITPTCFLLTSLLGLVVLSSYFSDFMIESTQPNNMKGQLLCPIHLPLYKQM